jgi:MFS family permease
MIIGGMFVPIPLFICSFVTNFMVFFVLYAMCIGCGFGLIYVLPLRNAWLFFPNHKGMVSGIILSCYSIGAIFWIITTTAVANPNNIQADYVVSKGDYTETLYAPDSEVV